jgi:putative endonuclease
LFLFFFLSFPNGESAVAFALAFLVVIPEGNLLLDHGSPTHHHPCYAPAMPQREYQFWVYILSSRSRNLYVGMTNGLIRRTARHREVVPGTHTGHYAIHRLVYYEYFQYVRSAIAREKELKKWTRAQKIELIERFNPTWEDLYPKFLEPVPTFDKQIPSGNDKPEKQEQKQRPKQSGSTLD